MARRLLLVLLGLALPGMGCRARDPAASPARGAFSGADPVVPSPGAAPRPRGAPPPAFTGDPSLVAFAEGAYGFLNLSRKAKLAQLGLASVADGGLTCRFADAASILWVGLHNSGVRRFDAERVQRIHDIFSSDDRAKKVETLGVWCDQAREAEEVARTAVCGKGPEPESYFPKVGYRIACEERVPWGPVLPPQEGRIKTLRSARSACEVAHRLALDCERGVAPREHHGRDAASVLAAVHESFTSGGYGTVLPGVGVTATDVERRALGVIDGQRQ